MSNNKRKFGIFILTNGRPKKQHTLNTLKKSSVCDNVFLLVDDQDKTINDYVSIYAEKVIIFNKKKYIEKTDSGDNFGMYSAIIYARNACFDIATELGFTHFLQLDDDYTEFRYTLPPDRKMMFSKKKIKSLGSFFDIVLDFLDKTEALSVAIAQGGDFIGGKNCKNLDKPLLRKCMNSFFCRTDRKFDFVGRLNEDVNTYTSHGRRGGLFLTVVAARLTQKQTQKQSGGMTGSYVEHGTFLKSFYSVMYTPSAVKISMMNSKNKRIHHRVSWNNCVPKILASEHGSKKF